MSGRRKNRNFDILGFELVRENKKYFALCKICNKRITNTGSSRLESHRRKCLLVWNEPAIDTTYVNSSLMKFEDESMIIEDQVQEENEYDELKDLNTLTEMLPPEENFASDTFKLNELLAEFVFGCNIPFSVINSDHFKKFIKKLNSSYAQKLPGYKELSTTLLNHIYQKSIDNMVSKCDSESILLIDGWKNASNNTKTFVTMIHNENGVQAFLNVWDFIQDPENSEILTNIMDESVKLAKSMYNTQLYACVSENTENMEKIDCLSSFWHSPCHSYNINLLSNDILCDPSLDSCLSKVVSILQEFKHPNLEKAVLDDGGCSMELPCDAQWCSYKNSLKCYLHNLPFMKNIANNHKSKVKPNIRQLLFDNELFDECEFYMKLFVDLCTFIKTVESPKCLAADAVDLWIQLLNNSLFERYNEEIYCRKEKSLNIYALAAYYFHPKYDIKNLSENDINKIEEFIIAELDAQGISNWTEFIEGSGFFRTLNGKNIENPFVYWKAARIKYSKLSILALRLLKIPASSAQHKKLFSNWSYVHSNSRNQLTSDESKKLIHVYYSLKVLDKNVTDEY